MSNHYRLNIVRSDEPPYLSCFDLEHAATKQPLSVDEVIRIQERTGLNLSAIPTSVLATARKLGRCQLHCDAVGSKAYILTAAGDRIYPYLADGRQPSQLTELVAAVEQRFNFFVDNFGQGSAYQQTTWYDLRWLLTAAYYYCCKLMACLQPSKSATANTNAHYCQDFDIGYQDARGFNDETERSGWPADMQTDVLTSFIKIDTESACVNGARSSVWQDGTSSLTKIVTELKQALTTKLSTTHDLRARLSSDSSESESESESEEEEDCETSSEEGEQGDPKPPVAPVPSLAAQTLFSGRITCA